MILKKSTIDHVSKMMADKAPLEKIIEEILKCDVVCSNCHRERTQQRLNALLAEKLKRLPEEEKRSVRI